MFDLCSLLDCYSRRMSKSMHLSLDADDDSRFNSDVVDVVGDSVDDKIAVVVVVVVVVRLDINVLDIHWLNHHYADSCYFNCFD